MAIGRRDSLLSCYYGARDAAGIIAAIAALSALVLVNRRIGSPKRHMVPYGLNHLRRTPFSE